MASRSNQVGAGAPSRASQPAAPSIPAASANAADSLRMLQQLMQAVNRPSHQAPLSAPSAASAPRRDVAVIPSRPAAPSVPAAPVSIAPVRQQVPAQAAQVARPAAPQRALNLDAMRNRFDEIQRMLSGIDDEDPSSYRFFNRALLDEVQGLRASLDPRVIQQGGDQEGLDRMAQNILGEINQHLFLLPAVPAAAQVPASAPSRPAAPQVAPSAPSRPAVPSPAPAQNAQLMLQSLLSVVRQPAVNARQVPAPAQNLAPAVSRPSAPVSRASLPSQSAVSIRQVPAAAQNLAPAVSRPSAPVSAQGPSVAAARPAMGASDLLSSLLSSVQRPAAVSRAVEPSRIPAPSAPSLSVSIARPVPSPAPSVPAPAPVIEEPVVVPVEAPVAPARAPAVRASAAASSARPAAPSRTHYTFTVGNDETVHLEQGNLLTQPVGAIVNAANEACLGGGGIDGIIHQNAGPELRAWLANPDNVPVNNGVRCPTGSAISSPAFGRILGQNGYRSHIVHTVGPDYRTLPRNVSAQALAAAKATMRTQLHNAYYNSLMEARRLIAAGDMTQPSIAFCGISIGIFAYPADEAMEVLIGAIRAFRAECTRLNQQPLVTTIRLIYTGRNRHGVEGTFPAAYAAASRVLGAGLVEA